MRKLTEHIVEGDSVNHQLQIEVTDDLGAGGAHHEYLILLPPDSEFAGQRPRQNAVHISFQNGPIKEFGVNGLTHEALLAIVMDRLRSFQAGPYACDDNARAFECCEDGLYYLQKRTRARIARQVEGTHIK